MRIIIRDMNYNILLNTLRVERAQKYIKQYEYAAIELLRDPIIIFKITNSSHIGFVCHSYEKMKGVVERI